MKREYSYMVVVGLVIAVVLLVGFREQHVSRREFEELQQEVQSQGYTKVVRTKELIIEDEKGKPRVVLGEAYQPIVRSLNLLFFFQVFPYPGRITTTIEDCVYVYRILYPVVNGEWKAFGEKTMIAEIFGVDSCI